MVLEDQFFLRYSKTLLSPMSADASIPNLRMERIKSKNAESVNSAITIAPSKTLLRWPSKAIGINIVNPIASNLLKQKNSLIPKPVKAAKKGPIAIDEIGLKEKVWRIFSGPSLKSVNTIPVQPMAQRIFSAL